MLATSLHEERVQIAGLFTTVTTPRFLAANDYWCLTLRLNNTSTELGVFLNACTEGFKQHRTQVGYKFTIKNTSDSSKDVAKGISNVTFTDHGGKGCSAFMPLATLRNPELGYLNDSSKLKIHIQITAPVPEPSSFEAPKHSLSGDIQLVLDDGTSFSAHSLYVQHASETLSGMITDLAEQPADFPGPTASPEDAQPAKRAKQQLRLPLKEVSRRQMLLLLELLYSLTREKWLSSLAVADLVELARVAHRYAFQFALELVDSRLVSICRGQEGLDREGSDPKLGIWLTVRDAPGQLELAAALHLTEYEQYVAAFLGEHAHVVDLSRLDARAAAMLRGARKLQKAIIL